MATIEIEAATIEIDPAGRLPTVHLRGQKFANVHEGGQSAARFASAGFNRCTCVATKKATIEIDPAGRLPIVHLRGQKFILVYN